MKNIQIPHAIEIVQEPTTRLARCRRHNACMARRVESRRFWTRYGTNSLAHSDGLLIEPDQQNLM